MSASHYGRVVYLKPQQIRRRADARLVNPDRIEQLAGSLTHVGLLAPVIVRRLASDASEVYELLAGNHRFEALQKLNNEIPAVIREVDDVHAELIVIDDNLCREALSPAQEAAAVARRKELYEQLHPEATHGGSRKSTRQIGDLRSERFTKATATATGRSERAIQRLATRGEKIGSAVLKRITGTSLDKGSELDALATLTPVEQNSLIERAAAGEKVSVRSQSSADITISSSAWRSEFKVLMDRAPTREDCEWAADQGRRAAERLCPDIPPFLDRRASKA